MSATGGNPILDTVRQIVPNGTQPSSWLDDLGGWAAATSAGRATGRTTQADFNLRSAEGQQNANVQAADATLRQRAAAMANALRGRMLQGTTDAKVTGLPYGVNPPTITGGARPSNVVGAADLGKTVAGQGDAGLAAPPIQPQNFSNLAPSPNAFDTSLNVLGSAAPLLGVIGKIAGIGKFAAGGASGAGAAGSLLTNPITLAVGAGLGLYSLGMKLWGDAGRDSVEDWGNKNTWGTYGKGLDAMHHFLSDTLGPAQAEPLWINLTQKVGRKDTAAATQAQQAIAQALMAHGQQVGG